MDTYYSKEVNVQILVALMKAHGVKKVIVSPGTTNINFVASVQQDPYFELYSSVDERSAAYIACGLAAEQWRDLAAAPPDLAPQKPYILTYFLGPEPQKAGADKAKAMQDRGWAEYHLLERTDPKSCKAGPREFLYLIDHAQLILTDSFHACVFSFLFGRPFCVYPREGKETGMLSRIESLLKMFSLERKFSGSGLPNELLEHEYTAGYAALEKERGKAKRYLAASLAEILENKGAQQRTMRF